MSLLMYLIHAWFVVWKLWSSIINLVLLGKRGARFRSLCGLFAQKKLCKLVETYLAVLIDVCKVHHKLDLLVLQLLASEVFDDGPATDEDTSQFEQIQGPLLSGYDVTWDRIGWCNSCSLCRAFWRRPPETRECAEALGCRGRQTPRTTVFCLLQPTPRIKTERTKLETVFTHCCNRRKRIFPTKSSYQLGCPVFAWPSPALSDWGCCLHSRHSSWISPGSTRRPVLHVLFGPLSWRWHPCF